MLCNMKSSIKKVEKQADGDREFSKQGQKIWILEMCLLGPHNTLKGPSNSA